MPSPHDSDAIGAHACQFEQQVALDSLPGLIDPLARALGEESVGGTAIQSLLADAVHAECVLCGMRVSGADLIEASLGTDTGAVLGKKLERLRLGYCARNACSSRYYLVKFKDQPGVQWDKVWARARTLLTASPTSEPRPENPRPIPKLTFAWYRQWFRRPVPLGVVSVLLLAVFVRSGCRVPGISPRPRVFIVESGPGQTTNAPSNAPGKSIKR